MEKHKTKPLLLHSLSLASMFDSSPHQEATLLILVLLATLIDTSAPIYLRFESSVSIGEDSCHSITPFSQSQFEKNVS